MQGAKEMLLQDAMETAIELQAQVHSLQRRSAEQKKAIAGMRVLILILTAALVAAIVR